MVNKSTYAWYLPLTSKDLKLFVLEIKNTGGAVYYKIWSSNDSSIWFSTLCPYPEHKWLDILINTKLKIFFFTKFFKKWNHHEDNATLKSLSLGHFWLVADWINFFCCIILSVHFNGFYQLQLLVTDFQTDQMHK